MFFVYVLVGGVLGALVGAALTRFAFGVVGDGASDALVLFGAMGLLVGLLGGAVVADIRR